MNQRTTELYQQALEFTYNKVPKENWNADILHPIVSGKFAELIVRECIGCCEQVISDPVPESVDTWLNGGSQCIQEIKQHLGVE